MLKILREFISYFTTRWRKSAPHYLRDFWPYLLLALVAIIADFLSTHHFMKEYGWEHELHPVIRLFSQHLGIFWGPLISKLGQLIAALILTLTYPKVTRVALLTISFIYLYAAWFNFLGKDLYTPLFLRLLD